MSLKTSQDYLHITDPEAVAAIRKVRQARKDFIKAFSGKVQRFGLDSAAFEEEYSSGDLLRKCFVGGFISAKLYEGDKELQKKFKIVTRNSGRYGKFIVDARRMNRGFCREWEREVLRDNPIRHHMNDLLPIVFSNFKVDSIGRTHNCPIATIFWNVEGGVLIRLAWFGRSEDDWIVDSKHTFVKESEALRLQGR